MHRIRPNLTYANVVSTLALFLVVAGGSAFAATQLAKNSVGAKQLKANAVTTAKIKKGAVTKAKLAANSVDATILADGSVTTAKIPDGAITGAKIELGSLGTVPQAATANNAARLGGFEPSAYFRSGQAAGGALAGTYPNPTLAPLEKPHVIGAPGEPEFAGGAGNDSDLAGFYKDAMGIVHLEGEVHTAPATSDIFTLPAGYRPETQVCAAASAFGAGTTFTVNRVCVSQFGAVQNTFGSGIEYVSLYGITFRAGN